MLVAVFKTPDIIFDVNPVLLKFVLSLVLGEVVVGFIPFAIAGGVTTKPRLITLIAELL